MEDGDRPAVTGSRDDLRGVAREGFPTELGETLFERVQLLLGARSINDNIGAGKSSTFVDVVSYE